VLGRFCPHDDLIAAIKDIAEEDGDPAPIPAGGVPLSWLSNRRVAHALITGRFADVGDPDMTIVTAGRLGSAATLASTAPRQVVEAHGALKRVVIGLERRAVAVPIGAMTGEVAVGFVRSDAADRFAVA
jgi:hypothetical protein